MPQADGRVAVLYPWPGLPAVDRGAARRVAPMIEVLARHFREVEVLSPGGGKETFCGKIKYTHHESPAWESNWTNLAYKFFDGITYHAWRGRLDIRQRRQWWHYLQPLLRPSLQKAIHGAAQRADVVLLEYPFWSSVLHRQCNKPVVLTMHDLLSEVVASPWLKSRVWQNELRACRRSQAVVCHSPSDHERLKAEGIDSHFVPPGFDLTVPVGEAAFPKLARVEEVHRQGDMVCLFIGSSLQPNRDAVEVIKQTAHRLANQPGIFFVVAGACCGPQTFGENLISLGPVSEEELNRLYTLGEVALAPVTSGSGSSLKVIEALVRKKILLCTAFGARGYGIISGKHAILCDDFSEYPKILLRLRENPVERKSLAEGGWQFVQAFDHKAVYQTYVTIIQGLLAGRETSS